MRAIRPFLAWWLFWLSSVACADQQPLDVEDLLSAEPQAEDYVEDLRCLPSRRIRSVTALDDRHIVFRISRDERYLVQLQRRCPGIRSNDTIAYESSNGMSVCRHDSIRGTFGYGPGSRQLGPRCRITGFQKVTLEQVELLREAIRQARKR